MKKARRKKKEKKILTVGWDSEFTVAPFKVLSHQLFIAETQEEIFVDLVKDNKDGIRYGELIGAILERHPDTTDIVLVSHFSRAELASLKDGRDIVKGSNLNYSSGTLSGGLPKIGRARVTLIDTQKYFTGKLEKIGEMLNLPKLSVGDYITRMDELYRDDYNLYYQYAMRDAKIAVTAYLKLKHIAESEGMEMAGTIGSIGDKYLHSILYNNAFDANRSVWVRGLGYEPYQSSYMKGDKVRTVKKVVVNKTIEARFLPVLHGGRNETFIRGYFPEVKPRDYDLTSAYTTLQSIMPTWDTSSPREFTNPDDCYQYLKTHPLAHGIVTMAYVEHKEGIKYPILPVKADNALIFVMSATGISLTAREFYVAYPDFKTIRGFHATVYPVLSDKSIVGNMMQNIRQRRASYKKAHDAFADAGLKNIGNSTYGKYTQGYAGKKSINLKETYTDKTGKLIAPNSAVPKSKVSNPMLSAWITGGIRAIAYELLNELDRRGYRVFYWTTDGFATDADMPADIMQGNFGIWSRAVADRLEQITASREMLELKHWGDGWLSIKTRAYAMLGKLHESDDDKKVLVSMTGLQMKGMGVDDKARFLVGEMMGLHEGKQTKYKVTSITPVREWLNGKEYGDTESFKAFNFDYDMKRKPVTPTMKDGLICHDTEPHFSADEFLRHRNTYRGYRRNETDAEGNKTGYKNKLLNADDYEGMSQYMDTKDIMVSEIKYATRNTPVRLIANYLKFEKGIGRKNAVKLYGISDRVFRNATQTRFEINHPEKIIPIIQSWIDKQVDVFAYQDTKESKTSTLLQIAREYVVYLKIMCAGIGTGWFVTHEPVATVRVEPVYTQLISPALILAVTYMVAGIYTAHVIKMRVRAMNHLEPFIMASRARRRQ